MAIENAQLKDAVNEALNSEIVGKKWYVSKTFWANVVAGLTMIGQIKYGFLIPAEYQMMIMSFVNIGLRKITKDPVIW
jgi:hypothetical protein